MKVIRPTDCTSYAVNEADGSVEPVLQWVLEGSYRPAAPAAYRSGSVPVGKAGDAADEMNRQRCRDLDRTYAEFEEFSESRIQRFEYPGMFPMHAQEGCEGSEPVVRSAFAVHDE